jgi:saccharopine dehydrogenase (NAD+, L-lysine-forming)
MSKLVVLGGCGAVGTVAVKTLAMQDMFSEIVIGDKNMEKAGEIISQISSKNVSAVEVDADNPESIKAAIEGADIVLNCIGPFYKTVKTILGAVIESGINYVDICDDVDVTFEVLDMDGKAKKAGITAVIGMGGSPGSTNLLAKYISDTYLDETSSIDIFHTHGGESIEGAGVIGHRFHSMSIDIPMYLDGELKYVKFFEDDGIALRQDFEFPVVGTVPLYPYPHPEQVTLPKYIDVAQVTNKGSVLPIEYYRFIAELCRLGLGDKEPLYVNGQTIVPRDFAIAYVIRERERILKETDFGEQRGAMSIIVTGKKDGEPQEYRAHIASRGRAMREATGLPAAMGVILMQQGKITAKGALPPEGCIDTADFINLAKKIGAYEEKKEGGLTLEKIDSKGNVTLVDI